MKKVLVSDYDGTFYRDDIEIKKNIEMVNKFRALNNLFVIATGRSYVDLKIMIDKYKIPFDYLILNHGALILSKDLKVLNIFSLDERIVKDILNYVSNSKIVDEIILIDTFNKNVKDTTCIVKIMLKLYNFDQAREIKNVIDRDYTNIKSYFVKEDDHYLVEIVSIKASKSFMIEEILNKEKIVKTNVFAIGDGINDIDMLKNYNGYRIKNSCRELYPITSKIAFSVGDLISNII